MKNHGKQTLFTGIKFTAIFIIWTVLIQNIDVQTAGPMGTSVGFASFNAGFHHLTGVHMILYTITDWLGLIPVFVCLFFGCIGAFQLCSRKSFFNVDRDLRSLGIYYIVVIFAYLAFEIFPVNYRPILIEGFLEPSYPSSTTLLVLSVMPTLNFQSNIRLRNVVLKRVLCFLSNVFSAFMVIGRLISGVHWFTDIVGAGLLSTGLFHIYKAAVYIHHD